jgi:hypothetical protein
MYVRGKMSIRKGERIKMRRGDMCKSNYSPHTGGTMKQMSYSYEDQQGWQHRENAVWRKCIVEHT